MSTQKPQPKSKTPQPEQRDELTLDAETITDLEPKDHASARVAGGGRGTSGCVIKADGT